MTALARDWIVAEEGWRSHAYKDSEGWWTIGHGFLIDQRRPGRGLPRHIARAWLDYLLGEIEGQLLREVAAYPRLDAARRAALANMAYQVGVAGLVRFERMLTALADGDWAAAHAEALDSLWAKQTPARAARVAHALLTGQLPDNLEEWRP